MQRTRSYPAQASFDLALRLRRLAIRSPLFTRLMARIAGRLVSPLARRLGSGHTVLATVHGHALVMPAEHSLPAILAELPRYNQPLALAVEAIASMAPGSRLALVDVGANIGDTVAVIEQRLPGRCAYLCIEAEADMAELCRFNHQESADVQVQQAFIGEQEGASVWLQDDGRANPSAVLDQQGDSRQHAGESKLQRLDNVALAFAESHGGLSLIKVDTEGFDFSVLRSGQELLRRFQPSIFLEWYPELLAKNKEQPWEAFEFLQELGYHYLVFYTNSGDLHSYHTAAAPDRQMFRALASITQANKSLPYFDVFLTTSEAIQSELIELSIRELSRS